MSDIEIKDWIAPEKSELKPIQFVGCLQMKPNRANSMYFDMSHYPVPFGATKVERVGRHEEFDVIKVTRASDDDHVWFLGHWNDGVI